MKAIIDSFGTHLHVDLQQRGIEFSQLFKAHNHLRPALLEKMPPMQINRVGDKPGQQNGGVLGEENGSDLNNGLEEESVQTQITDNSVNSATFKNYFIVSTINVKFLLECIIGSVGRTDGARGAHSQVHSRCRDGGKRETGNRQQSGFA